MPPKVKVHGPELAEVPDDGGKWALLCEHFDDDGVSTGIGGILQDTNRRRLAGWKRHPDQWCPECQEADQTPTPNP